jgi:hypothetical protein
VIVDGNSLGIFFTMMDGVEKRFWVAVQKWLDAQVSKPVTAISA